MNTLNYVTADGLLKRIAPMLPADTVNVRNFELWAEQGLGLLNHQTAYETAYECGTFDDHTIPLPKDLKYILGVIISGSTVGCSTFTSSTQGWTVAKKHTGILSPTCSNCPVLYQPRTTDILTNYKSGSYIIAYLRLRRNEEGRILIPDDPNIMEALFHWVMYNYQLQMVISGQADGSLMQHHLQMWQTLSLRARNVDLPDLPSLENIRRMVSSLSPNSTEYSRTFTTLNDAAIPKT